MEFVGLDMDPIARIIFIVVGSIEVLVGVVGNCLLLAVLFTNRLLCGAQNHYNMFIANLAIADILTLGYWMTFFVLDLVLGYHPAVNSAHCVANGFIVSWSGLVSILSLVTISLNRYLHVCHSQLYGRVFTRRTTLVCTLALWGIGAALTMPPLFGLGQYTYRKVTHSCMYNKSIYPQILVAVFFFVPNIAIGYFNVAIFMFWKRARLDLGMRYSFADDRKDGRCLSCLCCCHRNRRKSVDEGEHDSSEMTRSPDKSTDDGNIISSSDTKAVILSSKTSTENNDNSQSLNPSVRFGDDSSFTSKHADSTGETESSTKEMANSETDSTPYSGSTDPNSSLLTPPSAQSRGGRCEHKSVNPNYTDSACDNPLSSKADTSNEKPEEDAITSSLSSSSFKKYKLSLSGVHRKSSKMSFERRESCRYQLSRKRKKQENRERAFVRSLLVVFLLMLCCTIPYATVSIVAKFYKVSVEINIIFCLVFLFNNSVNWVVYGFMNRTYRQGFAKLARGVKDTASVTMENDFVQFISFKL